MHVSEQSEQNSILYRYILPCTAHSFPLMNCIKLGFNPYNCSVSEEVQQTASEQ